MRWLFCFALTCSSSFAATSPAPSQAFLAECEDPLVQRPQAQLEDPIRVAELREAREAARALAPHLGSWAIRESDFDPELVERTFANIRQAGVDVDGDAVRSLFLVVQRYLVATLDFDGRLAALADQLHVDGATVGRLTNLLLQLDARAYARDIPKSAPQFLRNALDIKSFVKAELGDKLSAAAKSFLYWKFNEVLRQRLRYARLEFSRDYKQIVVRTPIGVYRINLTDRAVERPAIAEPYVSVTDAMGRLDDRVIHAQIQISTADAEAALYFRTAIRADSFLHPHASLPALKRFPQPTVVSDWQEDEVIKPLLDLDARKSLAHGLNGPLVLGLMMPVGTGKTPSGVSYLNRVPMVGKIAGVRPKHIVIVENTHLLRQAMATYQRDTGARPEKMAMLFGDNGVETLKVGSKTYEINRGRKVSPPLDWDVIFVTRTTFLNRQSTFLEAMKAENRKPSSKRRPFRVTIDEGQHTGTDDGEFEKIFDLLDQNLTREDRVLIVSATLDHPHLNIIRDRLGGAVVAPLLLPDELASLQRGEKVMIHARVQFIRAMIAGLINPIDPRSVAGKSEERPGGYTVELKRDRAADRKMYEFVAETIRNTRTPGGGFDRGLIFEPMKERATQAAELLSELLSGNTNRRVAWYAHSDLSTEEGARRIAWLRGTGEFLDTAQGHKFLTSVSQFLEGLDVPEVNLLVVMRNFQSLIAMMQLLGRGARIHAFKTSSRLIDLPGLVMQWLEEADILWLRASSSRANTISSWDEPLLDAIDLHDKPDEDLLYPGTLTTRPIDLEPIYTEERQRLAAWTEIRARDLVAASEADDGVLGLLRRDPEDTTDVTTVNFSAWFGHFQAQFPEDVRAEWQPKWQQLKLDQRPVDPLRLSVDQRKTAIRAFRLLGRMFNGLADPRQRLGLADLETDEELTRSGFARVRLGLTRRPVAVASAAIPRELSPLAFGAAEFAQVEDLRESLAEGLLFAHSSAHLHRAIEAQAKVASAFEALSLVGRIVEERPALARAIGEYFASLRARVTPIPDAFQREIAATYALALLVNVLIRENRLDASKPWDLHALVHRRNGHDVLVEDVNERPTFHDLMMALDFADSRLGGAELAAAVEEKVEAPPVAASPPPAPIEDLGGFTREELATLKGASGTATYLQRTRGRGKLREPEGLLAKMLDQALHGPRPESVIPAIPAHAGASESVRLAHALVGAEDIYRATSARARLGLPVLVPRESFNELAFRRMMHPLSAPTFTLPVTFDAASVNAHLAFEPLDPAAAASLKTRWAEFELFDDSSLHEFVGAELPRLAKMSNPLAVLELVVDILREAPWAYPPALGLDELAAHVTRLRRTPETPEVTRAFAISQLAWLMNVLIVSGAHDEPLWSLAALSPLRDRERPVEPGLRTAVKVSEVMETLSLVIVRPGAGRSNRRSSVDPRALLSLKNWSVVGEHDLVHASKLFDELNRKGVREMNLGEFLQTRRKFSPEIEKRFDEAWRTSGLPKRAISTDLRRLKSDELWTLVRLVRLLGALYNELAEVDRLGAPLFTHESILSLTNFGNLSKVFNTRFNAPLKLSAFADKVDRRIEAMPIEAAVIWRKRMVADEVFGGVVGDRFVQWAIGGFHASSTESLAAVVDQIHTHPRLKQVFGEEGLSILDAFAEEVELEANPNRMARSTYVAVSHLVNYLIRDEVRTEHPWDTANRGERSASDPGRVDPPNWEDVVRVLEAASWPEIDDKLAAFGVTGKDLADFSNPQLLESSGLAQLYHGMGLTDRPSSYLFKTLFDVLRSVFPPAVVNANRAKLAAVQLPTSKTSFPNPQPAHARAIAHALLVYQDLLNGLDEIDRVGLAKLRPKAVLNGRGLIHLVSFADGYESLDSISPDPHARLAAHLRAGPDLRGRFAGTGNATEVLKIVRDISVETGGFGGRIRSELARFMNEFVELNERRGAGAKWAGRSALVLARVVNELIRAERLTDLKPWASEEAYSAHPHVFEPLDPARHNLDPTLADLTDVLARIR